MRFTRDIVDRRSGSGRRLRRSSRLVEKELGCCHAAAFPALTIFDGSGTELNERIFEGIIAFPIVMRMSSLCLVDFGT